MTTAHAQKADRFDEWLQGINQVCGRFGAKVLGSDFSGSIREHKAGAIKLSVVDVTQAKLFRTEREVAQSDGQHFYLALQLEGHAGMEQGGNGIALAPGDITLIESPHPRRSRSWPTA